MLAGDSECAGAGIVLRRGDKCRFAQEFFEERGSDALGAGDDFFAVGQVEVEIATVEV